MRAVCREVALSNRSPFKPRSTKVNLLCELSLIPARHGAGHEVVPFERSVAIRLVSLKAHLRESQIAMRAGFKATRFTGRLCVSILSVLLVGESFAQALPAGAEQRQAEEVSPDGPGDSPDSEAMRTEMLLRMGPYTPRSLSENG